MLISIGGLRTSGALDTNLFRTKMARNFLKSWHYFLENGRFSKKCLHILRAADRDVALGTCPLKQIVPVETDVALGTCPLKQMWPWARAR